MNIFKTIVALSIILSLAASSTAQVMKIDSVTRPAIYDARADQFRSFPNSRKDIIFLGNSITAYANWSELLGTRHAKNRGIPGDNTFGVLARLDEVIEGKPAKVFILTSINDIARNFPDSVIVRNYKKIVRRIREGSPATKIYLQTMFPVNNTFLPVMAHFNKDEHILAVNQEIRNMVASEGLTLIDLYPEFVDKENRLIKELTFDGLHLNGKGYLKWAELLKKGKYIK